MKGHVRGCPQFRHPSQRPADWPTDCRCPAPTPGTQTDRIVAFIRANPGCTVMQLQLGLDPFVANPRGRISDARAQGVVIECRKRLDGKLGYWVAPARPAPLSGEQQAMAL